MLRAYQPLRRNPRRRPRSRHKACGFTATRKRGSLVRHPPGMQPPGLSVAEQRMLNRSDLGLQSRVLPGGGVAVDLQGRYQSMAVATVDADGQAAVNCAITQEQAEAALQAEQQAGTGSAD